MPIDVTQSPGSDLARLVEELGSRQDRLNRLWDYYSGDCDLPEGARNSVDAYRQFQQKARTNFSELVVSAVLERMQPTGFRTGAEGDDNSDKEAWRIWQANGLDADSSLVHEWQLAMGDAYVIVGGVDDEIGAPVITPEDPRQVITEHHPIRRRKVTMAAKVFKDEVRGRDVAYLYGPGYVATAERESLSSEIGPRFDVEQYEWVRLQTLEGPIPVVRFANRSHGRGHSRGEFETVMDILDRINHMVLQRLVIATAQAFKQKAIEGLPTHDADGNPIDYTGMFTADPGALWQLPEGSKLWEGAQTDIGGILSAVKNDIQDLAAITRTPLFYLTPDAANGSAEGASLAREGLVFKTKDRIVQAGESWEDTMALAFLHAGDAQRAKRGDMEVIWAPPERHSLAERADAAAKALAAEVPWRTVMLDIMQYSPQQVDRMEAERATSALLAPGEPATNDAEQIKAKADAMGILIRAGVSTESAAAQVGLRGIEFTGAVPVSLRLPSSDAAPLEEN